MCVAAGEWLVLVVPCVLLLSVRVVFFALLLPVSAVLCIVCCICCIMEYMVDFWICQ